MRTENDWLQILIACGCSADTALVWSPIFAAQITDTTFSKGDADLAPFLGQMLFETGELTQLEENLNYSAQRLTVVWENRFPTLEDAQPFARNPQALANKVYGGRMGNIGPNDGWLFRGRGMPMVTGRSNYAAVGALIGQDLISNPDLLGQPATALLAGVHYWEKRIPDSMLADTVGITRIINGGLNGLAQRQQLVAHAITAVQQVPGE